MANDFLDRIDMGIEDRLVLGPNAKIAVIGGGPAGSFFSYFCLKLCQKLGQKVTIDIYEPKDFSALGPKGCNHCGGIISESMVQLLAVDGINLPPTVIQRGIESYTVHLDDDVAVIKTPVDEKRIAAVFRGGGPLKSSEVDWESFDHHLLTLALQAGARHISHKALKIEFKEGLPLVYDDGGSAEAYDLIVGACGLSKASQELFSAMIPDFSGPRAAKTFICEYQLGAETVRNCFGNSMHVFLLDIPRLKFAAFIPKGNHVTLAMLGENIDKELIDCFLKSDRVRACFPNGFDPSLASICKCFPEINVGCAALPYGNRVVMIGDAAVARLYKDGIGSAYRTAKAAATTVVLQGIKSSDFKRHYRSAYKSIEYDNNYGRVIFSFTRLIQQHAALKRGIAIALRTEASKLGQERKLSAVLWDTFTGSASYKDIFFRFFDLILFFRLVFCFLQGFFKGTQTKEIAHE